MNEEQSTTTSVPLVEDTGTVVEQTPSQTETSSQVEVPPGPEIGSPSPAEVVRVSNAAEAPLDKKDGTGAEEGSRTTTETRPDGVTITEIMTPPPARRPTSRDLWAKFLDSVLMRKRKRLNKIMEKVGAAGEITNDQVEKMLRVSDATARRYLDTLEKEGKLRQVGKAGKYTHYEVVTTH